MVPVSGPILKRQVYNLFQKLNNWFIILRGGAGSWVPGNTSGADRHTNKQTGPAAPLALLEKTIFELMVPVTMRLCLCFY